MSEPVAAARYALRRLRRRPPRELTGLLGGLALAVAAAAAVGLFASRVAGALGADTGAVLGADLRVTGVAPIGTDLLQRASALRLSAVRLDRFPSVVAHGERFHLATVEAVESGYPLRGQLLIADAPFAAPHPAGGVPPPGQVWVDAALWTALQLSPGAVLELGHLRLSVTAVIVQQPGAVGFFDTLAPRLLFNRAQLAASGLLGPGSRVEYQLLLAGSPAALQRFRRQLPPRLRAETPRQAQRTLDRTLDRAARLLRLAVLATALLAAAAVALSARALGLAWRDEVALVKTLGARRRFVAAALCAELALIALLAIAIGLALGALGQAVLAHLVAPMFSRGLPPPQPAGLLPALALPLPLLLGFAGAPLWAAAQTPPLRVLQRTLAAAVPGRLAAALAVAAVLALLWQQTRELRLAGIVLGGALATLALLAAAAAALLLALRRLPRRGRGWRLGLVALQRRGAASLAQMLAIGIALLGLLLVTQVRAGLVAAWQARLPADASNLFLINLQPPQLGDFRAFMAAHGYPRLDLQPMVRARLLAINGTDVRRLETGAGTRRWIDREFNLSWRARLGADNRVLSGRFWSADSRGRPWLSVDRSMAQRLQLALGDRLRFDVGGQPLELRVTNIREVRWDSFRPNFFLLAPPGVVPAADAQWITSLYLPPPRRDLLRELVAQFPNLTVFDIDAILQQVRQTLARASRAVALVCGFALAAGVLVLLAALQAGRPERAREAALLRALGVSRALLWRAWLAEFGVLGAASGLVAGAAAQGLGWALGRWVFEAPFGLHLELLWQGAAAGALLVLAAGWLGLRRLPSTPPRQVLDATAGD
ncbi:MAG: FtsX-like permease family protein [Gammaproteobacteria bacterium]|nr:FtsX-like permease family protein [Gammaproteobacteria bacterium]